MGHVGVGHELEQFSGEVLGTAAAGGGKIEFAGILFDHGKEFRDVLGWK